MYTFFQSSSLLCTCLVTALSLPTTARATTCPEGIYRGKVAFSFIGKDVGPITSSVDNMLFFYQGEPKDLPRAPNALILKNVMLCSDGDMAINTVTKHIGKYTFMNKKCDISLNGTGQIKDTELTEQGKARLTCQDTSVFQGNYSIRATRFLHSAGNYGNGPEGENPATETPGSSSSNGWDGLILQPIQDDNETDRQGLEK